MEKHFVHEQKEVVKERKIEIVLIEYTDKSDHLSINSSDFSSRDLLGIMTQIQAVLIKKLTE